MREVVERAPLDWLIQGGSSLADLFGGLFDRRLVTAHGVRGRRDVRGAPALVAARSSRPSLRGCGYRGSSLIGASTARRGAVLDRPRRRAVEAVRGGRDRPGRPTVPMLCLGGMLLSLPPVRVTYRSPTGTGAQSRGDLERDDLGQLPRGRDRRREVRRGHDRAVRGRGASAGPHLREPVSRAGRRLDRRPTVQVRHPGGGARPRVCPVPSRVRDLLRRPAGRGAAGVRPVVFVASFTGGRRSATRPRSPRSGTARFAWSSATHRRSESASETHRGRGKSARVSGWTAGLSTGGFRRGVGRRDSPTGSAVRSPSTSATGLVVGLFSALRPVE